MHAKPKLSHHHGAMIVAFCAVAALVVTDAHAEALCESSSAEYTVPELDKAPQPAFLITIALLSPFDPTETSMPANRASNTDRAPQNPIDQAASRNDSRIAEISDAIGAIGVADLSHALPLRRYKVERRSPNDCSDPIEARNSARGFMLGTQIIEFSAAQSLCEILISRNKFCLVMPPR